MEQQLTLPFGAPKTMFNVPIGGARRCAAQSWPIERFLAVKKAAGVTLNDVVLAMCGGALRAYLLEQNALPDQPLIAMVPVSLRDDALQRRQSGRRHPGQSGHRSRRSRRNVWTAVQQRRCAATKTSSCNCPSSSRWRCRRSTSPRCCCRCVPVSARRARPAVQPGDLECAGSAGTVVLERSPARWQLPALDRPGRSGAQHHPVQQRRQPRFRTGRVPAQRAESAAHPRPSRGLVGRPRAALGTAGTATATATATKKAAPRKRTAPSKRAAPVPNPLRAADLDLERFGHRLHRIGHVDPGGSAGDRVACCRPWWPRRWRRRPRRPGSPARRR